MSTRAERQVVNDAYSEVKYKAQDESNKAVATASAASKLVADQGYIIYLGSTTKCSRMNPTYNTMEPNHFKPPMHLKIAVKFWRNQITSVDQIWPPN